MTIGLHAPLLLVECGGEVIHLVIILRIAASYRKRLRLVERQRLYGLLRSLDGFGRCELPLQLLASRL